MTEIKQTPELVQLQKLMGDGFIALDIRTVNRKPHQYCIGPRHVKWAAINCGGMLSTDSILDAEKSGVRCARPGCSLSYDQHTADRVLFISLTRNLSNKEAADALSQAKEYMLKLRIDGVTFVDTPQKYRIDPPKTGSQP